MLRSKHQLRILREKGFSLFEVIIALFIALLFFFLVIQASALSSVSKAQAQEASEVLSWLQKDSESVKYQASNFQMARVRSASLGSLTVFLQNAQDELQFKTGDIIEFITTTPDGVKYTISAASQINADGIFSLTTPLQVTYPTDSLVIVRSRFNASVLTAAPIGSKSIYLSNTTSFDAGSQLMFSSLVIPTSASSVSNISGSGSQAAGQQKSQDSYEVKNVSTNVVSLKKKLKVNIDLGNAVNLTRCNAPRIDLGYADELRDQLLGANSATTASSVTLDPALTKTAKGKQYSIKRLMEIIDVPPYNMLQVSYETTPQLPSVISLDSFITRVMPDIVFYCN